MEKSTGSCLCGAVRYEVQAWSRGVLYCHCSQCRKQSGHFVAAAAAEDADLTINGREHLSWYAASEDAKRGFCRHCGSLLFWKHRDRTMTSIMAGSVDLPTGLAAIGHLHAADKGDYYEIMDGLPQG